MNFTEFNVDDLYDRSRAGKEFEKMITTEVVMKYKYSDLDRRVFTILFEKELDQFLRKEAKYGSK